MKILIYDNNPADLSKLCTMLEALTINFLIDKASNYNDCIEFYNKYPYDMVFIDFADKIGENILFYILEKNPNQKIITISDIEECSEKQGCNFCTTTYNKKRVIKPIQEIELIKILSKREPCKLYCSRDLLIKLDIISKGVTHLTFDKERFTFIKNGQNYHKEMSDIIRLSESLTKVNINFKVIENGVKIITN